MKKLVLLIGILTSVVSLNAQDVTQPNTQQNLPTVAVATPHVAGIETEAKMVAKMIRLELIKMQNYKVYDEFDMNDVLKTKPEYQKDCFGQACLINLGAELNTDFVICASVDALSNRIAITMKIVDVKKKTLHQTVVKEFDDQEYELQRMIEILLKEMHGTPLSKEITDRVEYKNEPLTTNNVGRINNSGPRIGGAFMTGSLNEFALRPESQGGLNIQPYVSMIGYQFEKQYVGTEVFSALLEGIVNVSGLEQGRCIPSFTIMNGFRFGKAGWEIAFGPGFGVAKTSNGFFDSDKNFSEDGRYFSESDWYEYANREFFNDPEFNQNGYFEAPQPSDINPNYQFNKHGDMRGTMRLNTTFVFAFGRTFHAGALNIPVNTFYSAQKGGGMLGINVGFNVQKSKTPINR